RKRKIEAPPERKQPPHGKAEAGEADLQLEGTALPSDETRRQFPEKDVQDEIVEGRKSDREQHEIREQRFDDQRKGARRARPPKRDGGSEQTQHEKRQREVAEDERDDVFHRSSSIEALPGNAFAHPARVYPHRIAATVEDVVHSSTTAAPVPLDGLAKRPRSYYVPSGAPRAALRPDASFALARSVCPPWPSPD